MLFRNDSIFVIQSVNSTFGSESGIYFSADNGNTWQKAAGTGLKQSPVDFSISGNMMYAASTNGGVYVSPNSGKNWTRMTSPAFAQYNVFNIIQAIGDTVYTNGNNTIYRSLDKGVTWMEVPQANLPTNQGNLLCINRIGNRLYAGVEYRGIYYSEDNGQTWKNMVDGFPSGNSTSTYNLLSNNGRLFAMTTSGFFQRSIIGGDPFALGFTDLSNTISENEYAVYPNPGSGYVTVSSLNNSRFKLMEQSGRLIFEKEIEGEVKININYLQPGIYFYNFSGNKTKKLLVE